MEWTNLHAFYVLRQLLNFILMFSPLFSDFGDEEVNKLISHFRPLLLSARVYVELIPDQWTILKTELYTAGFSQGTWRMMLEEKNIILMFLNSRIFKQVLEKLYRNV